MGLAQDLVTAGLHGKGQKRNNQPMPDYPLPPRDGGTPLRHNYPVALYEQIADILTARIGAGEYAWRLPSADALARELGCYSQTVRHAFAVLADLGVLVPTNRGHFLSDEFRADSAAPEVIAARAGEVLERLQQMRPESVRGL